MAVELADLLPPVARDDVQGELLSAVGRAEFPITDWHSGGVFRTLLELETETLEDLIANAFPIIVAEGFVEFSDGDWLSALAHGLYGIDRTRATIAQQSLTLACAATAGPHVLVAGSYFFTATDGKRYVGATSGTLSSGGTLAVNVTAESPGAALGLVNALDQSTPKKGVTITAAAIRVISSVSQFGSNDEPDASLISRCMARWPDLDPAAMDRIEKWARAGSAEVTRIRLDADPVNAGGVIVTLAGPLGGVTGGAVIDVQDYIDARLGITDYVTAQAATNLTVTAGGTATVPAALIDEIRVAADTAWSTYIAGAQVGTTVYVARLIQAVMDAGAIDFVDAELNGGGDVSLASTEVPVTPPASLIALITWVSV